MQMHQKMMGQKKSGTRSGARFLQPMLWALAFLCFGTSLNAQDSLKYSLAGEAASRARRGIGEPSYNVKLGPASLQFSAGSSLQYNDNVGVNSTNLSSDFILTPSIGVRAIWPVTAHNTLNFSMSVGYSKYFKNSDLDSLVVTASPDSGVSFDVFVGDFKINLHDRFSYVQNPVQQGSISGGTNNNSAASFGTAQNTIGINADWDLNKVVVSVGYDHAISLSTSTGFSQIDNASDNFFVRVSLLVRPGISLGLEATTGITSYDQSGRNGNQQFSLGPYVSWQVSEHLSVSVRGGYLISSFSGGTATNATTGANGSAYGSVSLEHSVNQYISQSVSMGYTTSLGVNSDSIATTYVRHAAVWKFIRGLPLSADLYYELGEEAGSLPPGTFPSSGTPVSLMPESFTRFSASVSLGFPISPKLSSGLSYSFSKKFSNQPSRDYGQNTVSLSLSYQF